MPTVNDFYDNLRRALSRGTSLEQELKDWSAEALKFLERNTTFNYMRDTYFLLPFPDVLYFDLDLPRLKQIDSLSYFGVDGGAIPLTKINRQSLGAFNHTRPCGYWQQGTRLFFEGSLKPAGMTQEYPMILRVVQFSVWPSDGTVSHPLLEFADDLLKYQVMVQQAPALRKDESIPSWKLMRDESLQSVAIMQEELEKETEISMEYWGGTGRLYQNASECINAIEGMYDLPDTFGVPGLYHVGPG